MPGPLAANREVETREAPGVPGHVYLATEPNATPGPLSQAVHAVFLQQTSTDDQLQKAP